MKTKMLIMRPDLPHESQEVEVYPSENNHLDNLHRILDPILGGLFEHVYVLSDFRGGENYIPADMFVHEMGHPLGLPHNEAATLIYQRNAILNQGATRAELPTIAGPAILFEKRVWR